LVLRVSKEKVSDKRARVTTIKKELGRDVSFEEVAKTINKLSTVYDIEQLNGS
jgi:hypothetical protein